MAIFSSHLLDATNGSHAENIDVIIYQIKKMEIKKFFLKLNLMKEAEYIKSLI